MAAKSHVLNINKCISFGKIAEARPIGEMAEARPRGEAWTQEETILLIELWADERVQEQLENTPRRNIEIFKRICEDIKDRIPDFQRSPQECQAI